MGHKFDTGLAAPQRTVLRASVLNMLAGLQRPIGYLQAVIPWGGVIRGYTDDRGIDELYAAFAGRAPALAVTLGDRLSAPKGGTSGFNFESQIELIVYAYSNHPRDLELGRLAADAPALASTIADPGLDVILEHVEELLVGQRAGATALIKQIKPTREEEIRTEADFSLWAQRYEISLARNISANRGVTELLASLRTKVRTSDAVMAAPATPVVDEQTNLTP